MSCSRSSPPDLVHSDSLDVGLFEARAAEKTRIFLAGSVNSLYQFYKVLKIRGAPLDSPLTEIFSPSELRIFVLHLYASSYGLFQQLAPRGYYSEPLDPFHTMIQHLGEMFSPSEALLSLSFAAEVLDVLRGDSESLIDPLISLVLDYLHTPALTPLDKNILQTRAALQYSPEQWPSNVGSSADRRLFGYLLSSDLLERLKALERSRDFQRLQQFTVADYWHSSFAGWSRREFPSGIHFQGAEEPITFTEGEVEFVCVTLIASESRRVPRMFLNGPVLHLVALSDITVEHYDDFSNNLLYGRMEENHPRDHLSGQKDSFLWSYDNRELENLYQHSNKNPREWLNQTHMDSNYQIPIPTPTPSMIVEIVQKKIMEFFHYRGLGETIRPITFDLFGTNFPSSSHSSSTEPVDHHPDMMKLWENIQEFVKIYRDHMTEAAKEEKKRLKADKKAQRSCCLPF